MGYETDEYVLKCGCVKYVKTHDFFSDDKEISYKYCENHIKTPKIFEYEQSERRKQLKAEWDKTEKAKEYRKEYSKTEKAKATKREYQQADKYKEYKKEYNKQYRQENKETIDAIKTKKTECECGGCYLEKHKATHKRTIKHQEWEKQQS